MIYRCPACTSVVEVVTADEGTSSYRPLLTDEMVERAWGAYSEPGDDASEAEELDAMRHALEAALGGTA